MTTDLEVSTDRDIRIDETGDIATVIGRDTLRQQHVNALFRAGEAITRGRATPELIEDARIEIRRELRSVPYVERITSLSIEAADRSTLRVTVATDATTEPLSEEVTV